MAVSYAFGPFRLETESHILFRDGEPAMLGQRAAMLLSALLDRAGAPISKEALMTAAWPDLAVEASNLTVQIAALRRALRTAPGGGDWIETLPRRGYRYVGPSTEAGEAVTRAIPPTPIVDRPSIAVLPFANLSDDPVQDYFAAGMVEDIVNGLSRIRSLFVIARGSTFSYRSGATDAKRIGLELGVRYLLEGSVRKAADRVRIAVRLVDADSGGHVWAERYDSAQRDVFALQDEIALSIVGAIEPSLRRAEVARVRRNRTESLGAYDLVLRSQPDVDSGMPEQVTRALVLLDRALELDGDYALAHAYAALCYHCLFLRAGLREDHRTASLRHARAAIIHGQDDAMALTLGGFCIGMDGHDRGTAFAALDAALAVSPSTALTWLFGATILAWAGEAERAAEWAERGWRLSPYDGKIYAAWHSLMLGHFLRGRFEEAVRFAYKAVQANPAHSISYMLLAAALVKVGRLEEARTAAARVLQLQPSFRYGWQFAGVDCFPALADGLGAALSKVGLPE
jgi:TolB-like protein/Tfp pilus assembly protein PilF